MGKAKLIKVLGAVEDVAGAIPRVTATTRQGQTLPGLDLLNEYNKTTPTPRVGTIEDEIVDLTASQEASRRLDAVTNPKASTNEVDQTATPEEFTQRYNEQLKDTDYSKRSGMNVDEEVGEIDKSFERVRDSRERHDTMVSDIFGGLRANPRWGQNYDNWVGDSAYKGEIQFHVDVRTDPTMPDRLIQYDKPRQGGVHIGSNRAAESVPGMMEVEEFWKVQDELSESTTLLAQEAGLPVKEVHASIGRYINRFKMRQFGKAHDNPQLTMSEVYSDWDAMVEEIALRLGNDYGNAATVLGRDILRMPTPNTVPVVFRGKNGLLLQDTGGFNNGEILDQLFEIFNNKADWQSLDIAAGGADEFEITKNLQKWIESKGYDHIIYHNTVEDAGSLSIINWNEDLMKNVWDPEFYNVPSTKGNSAIATSLIMGALGMGVGSAALRTEK